MSELTEQQHEYLYQHMLVSPTIARSAAKKVDVDGHFTPNEHGIRVLWMIAKAHLDKYAELPTKSTYIIEIDKLIREEAAADEGLSVTHLHVDKIESLLTEAFDPDFEEAPSYAKEMLQVWLNERAALVIQRNLANLQSLPTKEFLRDATKYFERSEIIDDTPFNPLDMSDPRSFAITKTKPIPIGWPVVDETIGGRRKKHLMGVLAVSGGGKTLYGINFAVFTAKAGGSSYYFTWEQEDSDLKYRFQSCHTGMPEELFYEIDVNDPKNANHPTVLALKQELSPEKMFGYIDLVDCRKTSRGDNGIADVRAYIDAAVENGRPSPDVIVLDWLHPLADRVLVSQGQSIEYRRYIMSNVCSEAKQLANDYECQVILSNQLSTDVGAKTCGYMPTMYDSAEHRQFAHMMDACLIMTRPDVNKRCRIYMDKMRGESEAAFIQLNPSHGRINLEADASKYEIFRDPNGTTYWLDTSLEDSVMSVDSI